MNQNRVSKAVVAASTVLFSQWQQQTRQANLALLQQRLCDAEAAYRQALHSAEQLQQLDPWQDPHLAAFVISLHNLADLALLEGQPEQARPLLHRACQQLWSLSQQAGADDDSQNLLLPHLQLCRRELAFFCQNFGPDPASRQLLAQPCPLACH